MEAEQAAVKEDKPQTALEIQKETGETGETDLTLPTGMVAVAVAPVVWMEMETQDKQVPIVPAVVETLEVVALVAQRDREMEVQLQVVEQMKKVEAVVQEYTTMVPEALEDFLVEAGEAEMLVQEQEL